MKKLLLVITCALAIGIFAGCGGGDEATIVTGAADLENAIIGVQEGTTGDLYVTENYPNATIERYKKPVDAAMDLKNGRLDAVVVDAQPAKKITGSIEGLKIIDEALSEEEYAIAVKKDDTELLAKINAAIKKCHESGNFDLYYSYFIDEDTSVALPGRKDIAYKSDIIMGTNAEFEPFEYREGEEIIGLDVEMAKDIAAHMEKNLKIEDMAFDSLIVALTSGKVDMVVAAMTATDERKEVVSFSEPYFNASQVIIVNAQ